MTTADEEGLAQEFRDILKPLEEGDISDIAAHDALNFLFCNWTQLAVNNELDDAGERADNYIEMYDALLGKLQALRPAAKEALEALDNRYPSPTTP